MQYLFQIFQKIQGEKLTKIIYFFVHVSQIDIYKRFLWQKMAFFTLFPLKNKIGFFSVFALLYTFCS